MVRYTLALAGEPAEEASRMDVIEEVVGILHGAQLDETFLCKINPKGQVPALTSSSLPAPITDSLDITHLICSRYPSLLPASYRGEIVRYLNKLHELSYFALSFSSKPAFVQANLKAINDRLASKDISDRYRKALNYKLSITKTEKLDAVQPDFVAQNETKTADLLRTLESLLRSDSADQWLFGLPRPTALDAHLILLIARLKDIDRLDLVPEKLISYAAKAFDRDEFRSVMLGRKTMVKL